MDQVSSSNSDVWHPVSGSLSDPGPTGYFFSSGGLVGTGKLKVSSALDFGFCKDFFLVIGKTFSLRLSLAPVLSLRAPVVLFVAFMGLASPPEKCLHQSFLLRTCFTLATLAREGVRPFLGLEAEETDCSFSGVP